MISNNQTTTQLTGALYKYINVNICFGQLCITIFRILMAVICYFMCTVLDTRNTSIVYIFCMVMSNTYNPVHHSQVSAVHTLYPGPFIVIKEIFSPLELAPARDTETHLPPFHTFYKKKLLETVHFLACNSNTQLQLTLHTVFMHGSCFCTCK